MSTPDPLELSIRFHGDGRLAPLTSGMIDAVAAAARETSLRVAAQAKTRFVGDRFPPEMSIPLDPLRVRKVVSYQQFAYDVDEDSDERRERAAAYQRERQAVIDANLATHNELLHLHPGDTIARAFLIEHRPHENVDFGERVMVCRGCPEVYDSYDSDEPAGWPCGPWRLVDERTPR